MSSRFIYVVAYDRFLSLIKKYKISLSLNKILLYVYAIFCLSTHPSMDIWAVSPLGHCEYAAVNVDVQISLQVPALIARYIPRGGISGS